MLRIVFAFSMLVLGTCLLTADAQDVKKKGPDLSAFTGKITDVNLNDEKKVDSLFVETRVGNRVSRRNVRINEKTAIEFVGFKEKKDEVLKAGLGAAVKINPETDYAITLKVSPTGAVPAAVPKKKIVK